MKNRFLYLFLLIIGLYLVVSLSRSILAIVVKGKAVEEAKNNVEKTLAENNKLNKDLLYVQSQEYIEKQAREKLNMSKKGETVVIVPEELTKQIATFEATLSASFFEHPQPIPNWKKWWSLFF